MPNICSTRGSYKSVALCNARSFIFLIIIPKNKNAGDVYGRKQALVMSVVVMGASTLSIACLPTYYDIGELYMSVCIYVYLCICMYIYMSCIYTCLV